MISRTLRDHLLQLFASYPVVTITGPRQAGKTTLCREALPNLEYVNLERPDLREMATEDPRGFLRRYSEGVIFDEIQRAPDLVSYLQVMIDEKRRNSLFVLTGSQQFRLSQTISQSLAGRTALLRLLPFSISEVRSARPDLSIEDMIYGGFYPRIHDQNLEPTQALGDYFETYVERDVRQISEIRNLTGFQRFVRLCAGRVGQLLNLHSLGNDAGVSHTTAREWLSVLEASFLVFRLEPYHANLSKRLIKSPKLYFYDVGLAAFLLGIENPGQIFSHPLRGALFENLVVAEALKHRFHQGKRNNLCFYRDARGHEVDLLYQLAHRIVAIEIKSGETLSKSHLQGLTKLRRVLGDAILRDVLVYAGDGGFEQQGVHISDPAGLEPILTELDQQAANREP